MTSENRIGGRTKPVEGRGEIVQRKERRTEEEREELLQRRLEKIRELKIQRGSMFKMNEARYDIVAFSEEGLLILNGQGEEGLKIDPLLIDENFIENI